MVRRCTALSRRVRRLVAEAVEIRNARGMQFAGVLPPDAPDPLVESRRRLLGLAFPLMGLVPQPTIEDTGGPAITEVTTGAERAQLAVSFSYTLWRNPHDRADPVNLKNLTPHEQAAVETIPPWPRPAWLIEYVERMRYPSLWEAVRTCWTRDGSECTTLSRQLVDHTNYILTNQFREESGVAPGLTEEGPWQVRPSSVNTAATIEIKWRRGAGLRDRHRPVRLCARRAAAIRCRRDRRHCTGTPSLRAPGTTHPDPRNGLKASARRSLAGMPESGASYSEWASTSTCRPPRASF